MEKGKDCTSVTVTNPDGASRAMSIEDYRRSLANSWIKEANKNISDGMPILADACIRIAREFDPSI